ncbi:MAG: triose-phosphate isomerase [Bacillota bacterium]
MRKPIVAANWKMYKTIGEAEAFVREFAPLAAEFRDVELVICPPFTALAAVAGGLKAAGLAGVVGVGGQNLYHEAQGAFTGEVSPGMLMDAGATHVITGHSERRGYFGETDQSVARKVAAALAAGLTPIVCVGEKLEERERGETMDLVARQTRAALEGLDPAQVGRVVIAYEPIWAIGTGKAATAADAQEVCRHIRETVRSLAPGAVDGLRIQYGGSVKPANAAEFMQQPDVDGALVGGASLEPASFAAIARGARRT